MLSELQEALAIIQHFKTHYFNSGILYFEIIFAPFIERCPLNLVSVNLLLLFCFQWKLLFEYNSIDPFDIIQ